MSGRDVLVYLAIVTAGALLAFTAAYVVAYLTVTASLS